MNVLVVEIDSTNAKLVQLVLEKAAFRTACVLGAERGFAVIRDGRSKVILINLGWTACTGTVTQKVPAVAGTCYADQFPKERALAVGCNADKVKPRDTRALPTAVANIAVGRGDRQRRS